MYIHQCIRVCNNPLLVNERAIRCITKYLASMSTYVYLPYRNRRLTISGVVYRSNIEKGIECYIDANFAGGWDQADADNAENVMLHMGYVITYAGCPVLWCSKLQTRNCFKYHRSGIYCIGTGDAQSNSFYGIDERSVFYLRYTSSKTRSLL